MHGTAGLNSTLKGRNRRRRLSRLRGGGSWGEGAVKERSANKPWHTSRPTALRMMMRHTWRWTLLKHRKALKLVYMISWKLIPSRGGEGGAASHSHNPISTDQDRCTYLSGSPSNTSVNSIQYFSLSNFFLPTLCHKSAHVIHWNGSHSD